MASLKYWCTSIVHVSVAKKNQSGGRMLQYVQALLIPNYVTGGHPPTPKMNQMNLILVGSTFQRKKKWMSSLLTGGSLSASTIWEYLRSLLFHTQLQIPPKNTLSSWDCHDKGSCKSYSSRARAQHVSQIANLGLPGPGLLAQGPGRDCQVRPCTVASISHSLSATSVPHLAAADYQACHSWNWASASSQSGNWEVVGLQTTNWATLKCFDIEYLSSMSSC